MIRGFDLHFVESIPRMEKKPFFILIYPQICYKIYTFRR